jgi:hypothetical protein
VRTVVGDCGLRTLAVIDVRSRSAGEGKGGRARRRW